MNVDADSPENVWDNLLSRESSVILRVYCSLSSEQRQAVLAHLQRMVSEEGWQPEQHHSAQAALDVIANLGS